MVKYILNLDTSKTCEDGDVPKIVIKEHVDINCVKSVHIPSYSGPHFPAFGLNLGRYSVSLHI